MRSGSPWPSRPARIDALTSEPLAFIDVGSIPVGVVSDGRALWVATMAERAVRLELRTSRTHGRRADRISGGYRFGRGGDLGSGPRAGLAHRSGHSGDTNLQDRAAAHGSSRRRRRRVGGQRRRNGHPDRSRDRSGRRLGGCRSRSDGPRLGGRDDLGLGAGRTRYVIGAGIEIVPATISVTRSISATTEGGTSG